MRKLTSVGLCLGLMAAASTAAAIDTVKVVDGKPISGSISAMSKTEVTISANAVPVNAIASIQFDAEPRELTNARTAAAAGRLADASAMLAKIEMSNVRREEIKADVDFMKAMVAARMALAGSGPKPAAGKLLLDFEKQHADNYHYFEACELIGDLFVSLGKHDNATKYYAKLADAPFPDFKMRAGLLAGWALLGAGQHAKAQASFEQVLGMDARGPAGERLKAAAELGKAAVEGATGKPDDAIKKIEDLVAKAPEDEDGQFYARAYNVLGNCYLKQDKKKDALLAFLHVDLLYDAYPEEHAEALANLSTLWNEVEKADRANQARTALKQRYPGSKWAAQK